MSDLANLINLFNASVACFHETLALSAMVPRLGRCRITECAKPKIKPTVFSIEVGVAERNAELVQGQSRDNEAHKFRIE